MGLEMRVQKFLFKKKGNCVAYIIAMSVGFWKEYECLS